MAATQDLLDEIKAGAEAIGIAPSTLCQRAVRHGGLVRRLENGGRVTLETVEQIRQYIERAPKKPVSAALSGEAAE